MQVDNPYRLPDTVDKEKIFKMFIKDICSQEEVWIHGQPFSLSIDYRITDPKEGEIKNKERISQEREGFYTQPPVLEINNTEAFKTALFEYVKTYSNNRTLWTTSEIANDWESSALFAMLTVWANATNQDFTNPISFLKRYTDFLVQDQWTDLRNAKQEDCFNKKNIWKETQQSSDGLEAPNNYFLYSIDENGQKSYSPSVVYGIQDDTAYVCAIQKLYGKNQPESGDLLELRSKFKGRVEPLAVAALISFIQEAKQRGINRIVMPDNFILRYISKIKIANYYFPMASQEELREREEEKADSSHRGSLDNRLYTLFLISKKYSTGLKFLEIPGEVSDNLIADIQDFKINIKQTEQSADRGVPNQEER